MTEVERNALQAALALLDGGFADYAETILERLSGRHGAEARARLARGEPEGAKAAIRERLSHDA